MAKKPTLTVSCCELSSAAYAVWGENIIHTHTKTSNTATYFFALEIILNLLSVKYISLYGKAYALLEQFFRKIVKEATGQEQPLYKVMEKMARTGRDQNSERTESRKIKVETTFDGTRVNPEKSGSITQICSENFTPEDFCYGVLKGMSTELYQMYMTIQKGIGIKIRRMIGSGNGLRKNPVLCEIIEDMFKAELVLAECEEEAATGAAMSSSMYNYSNSTR